MKQVKAMKMNVQMKFLNKNEIEYILLFEAEIFFFEEHVEHLVSERIVVYRNSDEEYHDNWDLSNHNSIISLGTVDWISI